MVEAEEPSPQESRADLTPLPRPTVTFLPALRSTTFRRRVAELVSAGARHPGLVLSAGAALTLAAEVGLRLLDGRTAPSALTRRARGAAVAPARIVLTETVTISRRIEIPHSK